jgi:hypothetical protein
VPAQEGEDEPDESWERRFRVASLMCASAVAVLIVTGIASGIVLDIPRQNPIPEFAKAIEVPRHDAFFTRASTLLSGCGIVSAILVLFATLLGVMGRSESDRAKSLAIAADVAGVVAIGALVQAAIGVWYVSVNTTAYPRWFGAVGAPIAAATIAAAAAWWAWEERWSA